MADEQEYILGTDDVEIARLRVQHDAWSQSARDLWSRAGIERGHVAVDLGSGPGFTSFDLAEQVGPTGRVIARDESARFLAFLEREARARGLENVTASAGAVEDMHLAEGSIDAAYARWLFCWLDAPGELLRDLASALRPGGVVVVQDYLDWGAFATVPRSAAFDAAVDACMASWREGGIAIDVMESLPRLARDAGFSVEVFEPVGRLGAVGSPEWRWVEGFFESYLPRLVTRGTIDNAAIEAWRHDWDAIAAEGTAWVRTPTVANLVLRRA